MFWRFGYQSPSTIDAMLDQEGVKLEQVLNEEDLLQEVKTRNEKLLTFLCKKENLEQLINYVVATNLEEAVMFRYPFLATEIMCCDVEEIVDAILKDTKLLDVLWDILERPPPIDQSHANSFAKIMGVFVTRNTLHMLAYIQARPGVIEKLLHHLESPGIVDLLLRLMTSDDFHDGDDVERWLDSQEVIEKIVAKFNPDLDEISHSTASFALMDMVAAYHHAQNPDPALLNKNRLVQKLKSSVIVDQLTSHMLDEARAHSSSCIINGINIIIELLRRGTCAEDYDIAPVVPEGGEFGNLPPPPPPIHRDAMEIGEVVSSLCKRVPNFKHVLLNPRKALNPVNTSNGQLTPLGAERLTITELFAELLRVQSPEVLKVFHDNQIFSVCLELFFTFPWNNLLHMVVCDMINTIFDTEPSSAKSVIISIFVDAKITESIVKAVRLNAYTIEQPKGVRLGYMGHLTLITDKILGFLEKNLDDEYRAAINPFAQSEDWIEFVSKIHRDTKERDSKPLGGQKTNALDNGGEEEAPFSMHVDMNTDQLARYLIGQVVKDLPSQFANAVAESASSDDVVWNDLVQESPFDAVTNFTTDVDQLDDDDTDVEEEDEKWPNSEVSPQFFSPSGNVLPSPTLQETQIAFPPSSDDPFAQISPTTPSSDGWVPLEEDMAKLTVGEPQAKAEEKKE
eukprot:Partr_v1_DN27363_c0_g1_i6_m46763 putative Protein phosphatase 6, regulatory subunit